MTHLHWVKLLQDLPLSRTEREILKRFEKEPEGKGFLPVSDILRAHDLKTESLELLTEGLDRFPTYSVARVVLIRELYENGMLAQAWQHLIQSPTPLNQNALAQKLSLRLHLILGKENEARDILKNMKKLNMVDQHIKALSEKLDIAGIASIRDQLIDELKEKGSEISFPVEAKVHKVKDVPPAEPSILAKSEGMKNIPKQPAISGEVDNFFVVSLKEIFNSTDIGNDTSSPFRKGVELDTKTLAEIYEKQGHYTKALAVYRRLFVKFPSHDLYKNKVAEMSRKEKELNLESTEFENDIIDQLESVELIDRQIDFFHQMLSSLPSHAKA